MVIINSKGSVKPCSFHLLEKGPIVRELKTVIVSFYCYGVNVGLVHMTDFQ